MIPLLENIMTYEATEDARPDISWTFVICRPGPAARFVVEGDPTRNRPFDQSAALKIHAAAIREAVEERFPGIGQLQVALAAAIAKRDEAAAKVEAAKRALASIKDGPDLGARILDARRQVLDAETELAGHADTASAMERLAAEQREKLRAGVLAIKEEYLSRLKHDAERKYAQAEAAIREFLPQPFTDLWTAQIEYAHVGWLADHVYPEFTK